MAKINDIIKAKLSDKSDMPEWYYKRVEICKTCPLYSLNFRAETIPDKVRFASLSALNKGEPFCWKCGCEVEAKASLPGEECPGSPRKWDKVRTSEDYIDVKDMDYAITNLSPEKVTMRYKRSGFEMDYGDIAYDSDTKIKLLISPKTEEEFINLKPRSGCGCTVPTIDKIGKDLILNIEYDSKRLNEFNKLVTLDYTAKNQNQISIRIKGNVKK